LVQEYPGKKKERDELKKKAFFWEIWKMKGGGPSAI